MLSKLVGKRTAFDPAEDARFMALALALGRRGLGQTAPNPAVGALLVQSYDFGQVIVGRGWTQPGGRPHAETQALARAGSAAREGTLFVTLEPCSHHGRTPPCSQAIIAAGITTVVSALEDPNPKIAGQGHAHLRSAGIGVRTGVCAEEARQAHAGHIRCLRDGRPHITLKMAVSADGKVGLSGRRPALITGERARDQVHLMRSMNDAILIGIGTALADDPMLTCRLPGMARRSPIRIVLDCDLRLPLSGRLVRTAREAPLWAIAGPTATPRRERALRDTGVDVRRVAASGGQVDLPSVVKLLADRGVTRLLVEGGPMIAAAFMKADLVDEIALFRGQVVIGPNGIDPLEGLPLALLTEPAGFRLLGSDRLGADTLDTFVRA